MYHYTNSRAYANGVHRTHTQDIPQSQTSRTHNNDIHHLRAPRSCTKCAQQWHSSTAHIQAHAHISGRHPCDTSGAGVNQMHPGQVALLGSERAPIIRIRAGYE
eukprot:9501394-Pyramimonas_sp.AAC.1